LLIAANHSGSFALDGDDAISRAIPWRALLDCHHGDWGIVLERFGPAVGDGLLDCHSGRGRGGVVCPLERLNESVNAKRFRSTQQSGRDCGVPTKGTLSFGLAGS